MAAIRSAGVKGVLSEEIGHRRAQADPPAKGKIGLAHPLIPTFLPSLPKVGLEPFLAILEMFELGRRLQLNRFGSWFTFPELAAFLPWSP